MWLQNPEHFSASELAGVLWILDSGTASSGTVAIAASVSPTNPSATATASIAISPMPAGDAVRGQAMYGANCAMCHGTTGQGMAAFPGLNNTPANLAGDPSWNAALLALAAQSDIDNLGVSLDPSMPKWLTRKSSAGLSLTPADFADIYAFLKTQTQ